jgi:hypothetical protein
MTSTSKHDAVAAVHTPNITRITPTTRPTCMHQNDPRRSIEHGRTHAHTSSRLIAPCIRHACMSEAASIPLCKCMRPLVACSIIAFEHAYSSIRWIVRSFGRCICGLIGCGLGLFSDDVACMSVSKQNAYNTCCSRVVPHPSTRQAQARLTSEF